MLVPLWSVGAALCVLALVIMYVNLTAVQPREKAYTWFRRAGFIAIVGVWIAAFDGTGAVTWLRIAFVVTTLFGSVALWMWQRRTREES